MNRRKRMLAAVAVICAAAVMAAVAPTALRLTRKVAEKVLPPDPAVTPPYQNAYQPNQPEPGPALPATGKQVYQNGITLASGEPDFKQDVKQVVRNGETQRFSNYPAGYEVTLPADMKLDFRYSPAFVRASRPNLDMKLSRERSPYEEVDKYIDDYPNRWILKPEFQQNNDIRLIENGWVKVGQYRTRIISFARTPAPGSQETENQYLFAYLRTEGREFYTFYFRTDSLEANRAAIQQVLESFTRIEPKGLPKYNLDFHPVAGKWNQETREYYSKLASGKEFQWGFYDPWTITDDPTTYGTDEDSWAKVESVQQALGYKFPILLMYRFVPQPFPMAGMRTAYERGHTVELTLQVAAPVNDDSPVHNANFDVLDGKYDEHLRQWARDAKAFGHPFLFRVSNEMNTDWSQYSGVLTMNDADVYIKVWRRIFQIFEEEGVDNAIWIFNPHDRSAPPMNWNADTAYYPGNGYVHLMGLTGYNNGTGKQAITGEYWRDFSEIYSEMANSYRPIYGRFPWIITEFASSSIGGDKRAWIEEMFRELPKYPEIKAAVWWSWGDFMEVDGKQVPARPYWLDEKPEYLEAFKQGLIQQKQPQNKQ